MYKIAIVVSRFNSVVTEKLLDGTRARLIKLGVSEGEIAVTKVPGAVELPLVAKQYAECKKYDAVICLGAVIRGETTHYDYVCQQVSYGCQRVALDMDIPVIFGVLTTENREQAFDRLGGEHGHKGYDSADTAIEMINIMRSL